MSEWTGRTHLTRDDGDGIVWRIRPAYNGRGATLTMDYRPPGPEYESISLCSCHASADAAKRHVDDLLASWAARTIHDYEVTRERMI